MTLTIRPAEPRNAERIVEMAQALTDYEAGLTGDSMRCALSEAALAQHCFGEAPLIHALVAEDRAGLLGYLIYYRIFDVEAAAVGLWMADLYVEPGARRRGIGRAFLGALAAACHERGASFVGWKMMAENTAAQDFYDRYGERDPALSYWSGLDSFERQLS